VAKRHAQTRVALVRNKMQEDLFMVKVCCCDNPPHEKEGSTTPRSIESIAPVKITQTASDTGRSKPQHDRHASGLTKACSNTQQVKTQ
jgi:hypothetical protein